MQVPHARLSLSFSSGGRPGDLSQEEALAILEQAEQAGLVHTVSNVMTGHHYICNCCSCCCGILRGITEFGLPHSVAAANYYVVIPADACQGCGVCVDRCQMHAIGFVEGVAVVDLDRCIGCGLCVSGCPSSVPHMQRKPEAEIVHPPASFAAWEQERYRHRGLASTL